MDHACLRCWQDRAAWWHKQEAGRPCAPREPSTRARPPAHNDVCTGSLVCAPALTASHSSLPQLLPTHGSRSQKRETGKIHTEATFSKAQLACPWTKEPEQERTAPARNTRPTQVQVKIVHPQSSEMAMAIVCAFFKVARRNWVHAVGAGSKHLPQCCRTGRRSATPRGRNCTCHGDGNLVANHTSTAAQICCFEPVGNRALQLAACG